jgi:acetyl esterase/lipase
MTWSELSQEQRDAAYNNSLAVLQSDVLNATRLEASAAYRAAHPHHLDLAYGGGERQKWDLFPGSDDGAPCLVFIHGGYWQRNRREDFACIAEGLAPHGWSVALPGYSLAPEVSLAGITAEIRAALDWLAANGSDHGIKGPLLIAGWSAGAHLAVMALDHPAVRGGLALSGVYDLAPIRDTYLNEKLRLTDDEIRTLSPLSLPPVAKKLLIAYGAAELPALVHDSKMLHAWRRNAKAASCLLPLVGANHFTVLNELRRPGGMLIRPVLDLAAELLSAAEA